MFVVGFKHKGDKGWEVPPWSIYKLGQTDISFSFFSSFLSNQRGSGGRGEY